MSLSHTYLFRIHRKFKMRKQDKNPVENGHRFEQVNKKWEWDGQKLKVVKSKSFRVYVFAHCLQLSATSWILALQVPLSMEITGVGSHFLLQRIFLTQGSNRCHLHFLNFRQIFYH